MKKQMSGLSAQEFVEIRAALGIQYQQLAKRLNRSHTTISEYSTGRKPIPMEVALLLVEFLKTRASELQATTGKAFAHTSIGPMIVQTNEIRQEQERREALLPPSALTLARRLKPHDHRTYPAYRCTPERYMILVRCVKAWRDEITSRLQTRLSDASRIQQHKLELADLANMVAILPKRMPYEVCITFTEWDVVSRALRWGERADIKGARSLWQHWRRYKGSGYPASIMRDRSHTTESIPA